MLTANATHPTRRWIPIILCLSMAAAAVAAPPEQTTITIGPERVTNATINGTPLRFAVSPSGLSFPVLNPAVAERLAIKRNGLFGIRGVVGTTIIDGSTAVIRLDQGNGPKKRRILWYSRSISANHDGEFGPGSFIAERVMFQLAPEKGGERVTILPMEVRGATMVGVIGPKDEPMGLLFDPDRAETLVTASAARALIARHGGGMIGKEQQRLIAFDINQPVKKLTLDNPLPVADLRLSTMLVRVPREVSADAPDLDALDPDTIVVIGNKKKKDKGRRTIVIGANDLRGCSSITFDKPQKRIVLRCVPSA